jgi:hypothetical protein
MTRRKPPPPRPRLTERVQLTALAAIVEALEVETILILAAIGEPLAASAHAWTPERRAAHGRRMRRAWQRLKAIDPTAHPGPQGKPATGPRRLGPR